MLVLQSELSENHSAWVITAEMYFAIAFRDNSDFCLDKTQYLHSDAELKGHLCSWSVQPPQHVPSSTNFVSCVTWPNKKVGKITHRLDSFRKFSCDYSTFFTIVNLARK